MPSYRWAVIGALVPAVLPALLWSIALLVRSTVCPLWCLTCLNSCVVAGLDLSWLLAWGIIGPDLLLVTAPVSALSLGIVLVLRRRAIAT